MNKKMLKSIFLLISLSVILLSCTNAQPQPVKINVDNCQHCKMTIADLKFSTELITDKGRINKFDDMKCMLAYFKENALNNARFFVADYNHPEKFVKAENAIFVSGGKISSPMNGNIAAFSKKEDAEKFAAEKEAAVITWKEIKNKN
jgi:copper chaperone NosL